MIKSQPAAENEPRHAALRSGIGRMAATVKSGASVAEEASDAPTGPISSDERRRRSGGCDAGRKNPSLRSGVAIFNEVSVSQLWSCNLDRTTRSLHSHSRETCLKNRHIEPTLLRPRVRLPQRARRWQVGPGQRVGRHRRIRPPWSSGLHRCLPAVGSRYPWTRSPGAFWTFSRAASCCSCFFR